MSATETPTGLRGMHVLAGMVAFFGVVIAADATFTVIAIRSNPGQVAVTPYEDGLAHNARLARLEAQARLGWRATAAVEPDGAVAVEMRDRVGRPLAGLALTGSLQRPATDHGRITLSFREDTPGRYVARPGRLSGTWDLAAYAPGFEAERRLTWP